MRLKPIKKSKIRRKKLICSNTFSREFIDRAIKEYLRKGGEITILDSKEYKIEEMPVNNYNLIQDCFVDQTDY
ncbi:MAG: hypothetical protein HOD92_14570 [Deltaproteobacteria bacterium]|nr:hypothetical protein [Deltaproteobacteria bacterium]MBT4527809.1 hypothetical protein [Deltaproteobacteria bacterium]